MPFNSIETRRKVTALLEHMRVDWSDLDRAQTDSQRAGIKAHFLECLRELDRIFKEQDDFA